MSLSVCRPAVVSHVNAAMRAAVMRADAYRYCGSFVITRPPLVNEIPAFALRPSMTASINGVVHARRA